ncbi:MAG: transketolase [Lachnospiraceae bacterium]|nr:transketolase [Lachnospiraceae bacterium]
MNDVRDTFVKTLIELAQKDKNIELITGDLGFGVLKPFWETCPNQFTNAGTAEQTMTTLAAGIAREGKTDFTYSIGNFPTIRCLEQIRNDCAYHNANVKIVCVGGGFVYGSLGMSHQATEDLAIMRALPDVVVVAPGDLVEAEEATRAIAAYPGTCYLRLGRGGEKRIHDHIDHFQIGKAIPVKAGERIAIFSTGAIFEEVEGAYAQLTAQGYHPAVYTFPTVKPIDADTIRHCAEECELIVTCEEHNIVGGFGSAVAEVMAEMPSNRSGRRASLLRIGLNDQYGTIVGSQKYLREQYGMSAERIAERIVKKIEEIA